MRAIHAKLSANGIKFVTDPLFNKTEGGGEHGIVYVQDPEGNWPEFSQSG